MHTELHDTDIRMTNRVAVGRIFPRHAVLPLELQAAAAAASVAVVCVILSALRSLSTVGSGLQIAPASHQM